MSEPSAWSVTKPNGTRFLYDQDPLRLPAAVEAGWLFEPLYTSSDDWIEGLVTAPRDGTEIDLWAIKAACRCPRVWWSPEWNGWMYQGMSWPDEDFSHWRPEPAPPVGVVPEFTVSSGNVFRDLGLPDPEGEMQRADERLSREGIR